MSLFDLGQLEDLILERECLRIVFRAPRGTPCQEYAFADFPKDARVQDLTERLAHCTAVPFVIVDGSGNVAHMRRKFLHQIASSYAG